MLVDNDDDDDEVSLEVVEKPIKCIQQASLNEVDEEAFSVNRSEYLGPAPTVRQSA